MKAQGQNDDAASPLKIFVVQNPGGRLSLAVLPEHEAEYFDPVDAQTAQLPFYPPGENPNDPLRLYLDERRPLVPGEPATDWASMRYYSNAIRERRKKFLMSLLVADIVYCLLLISTTHALNIILGLLICLVAIDVLGIMGSLKDNVKLLTAFIVLSTASLIAQSVISFSPLFILRLLIVVMAFRVRSELLTQIRQDQAFAVGGMAVV